MTEQEAAERAKRAACEFMSSTDPHRGGVLVADEALRDHLDVMDPFFVRWGAFLERLGLEEEALATYEAALQRRALWRARREFADRLEELAGLVRKGEVFACGVVAVQEGESFFEDFSDSPEQLLWLVSGLRHLERSLDDSLYSVRALSPGER